MKVSDHQVSPPPQGLPHPLLVGNAVKEGAGTGNFQGGNPTRWQSKSGNQKVAIKRWQSKGGNQKVAIKIKGGEPVQEGDH